MDIVFEQLKEKLIGRHESMIAILSIAKKLGEKNVFVAGGFVRDYCQNPSQIINGDIDLFMSDNAYQEVKNLETSHGKQIKNQFGSDRWFPTKENPFYYDVIKINDFYHGLWRCRDITDVLNQFDITANAVAFDLCTGEFYNPVNGMRDSIEKRIRAVRFDFPEMPVTQDIQISRNSVLWFRYNHYSNKLGYDIEPVTKLWIKQNSYRLAEIDLFKKYFFNPILLERY